MKNTSFEGLMVRGGAAQNITSAHPRRNPGMSNAKTVQEPEPSDCVPELRRRATVTMRSTVLSDLDAFCEDHYCSRSAIVDQAVQSFLSGADNYEQILRR